MSKITISMPDAMSDYVAERVAERQYGNVSEYFRDLVRRDRDSRALSITKLADRLNESRQTGISESDLDAIFEQAKKAVRGTGG